MFLPPPPVNRYFSDENDGLLAGNYSAAFSSEAAVGHRSRALPPQVGGDQFGRRTVRSVRAHWLWQSVRRQLN